LKKFRVRNKQTLAPAATDKHYRLLKKFAVFLEDLNTGSGHVAKTVLPRGVRQQLAPGGCSQARKTTAAFVCVYKENH
jgi:hypothetical protein